MSIDASHTENQDTVQSSVKRYIDALQAQFLAGVPAARGQLAELRKAVDETPGQNPLVWQMVLESLPEKAHGRGNEPSRSEWAAFTSLTLYSVHQRGQTQPMNSKENSFASAVGSYVRNRSASSKSRFDAVLTATSIVSQRRHLRTLVGLLASEHLPFDYGRFCSSLVSLQDPHRRQDVLRWWGREFYYGYARPVSTTI